MFTNDLDSVILSFRLYCVCFVKAILNELYSIVVKGEIDGDTKSFIRGNNNNSNNIKKINN